MARDLEKEYGIKDKDKLVIKAGKERLWKTRRGVGYEFVCFTGSIWNDGSGGPTYFVSNSGKHIDYDEWYLEDVIEQYENLDNY